MNDHGIYRVQLISKNVLLARQSQHGFALPVYMEFGEYLAHGFPQPGIVRCRIHHDSGRSPRKGKTVAEAPDSPDVQAAEDAQLFAQAVYMVIYSPFYRILQRPDVIQQLLPAEGAPKVAVQKLQESEFLGQQLNRNPARGNFVFAAVEFKIHSRTSFPRISPWKYYSLSGHIIN
ncbi:hypothetical protein D3C75_749220 [compost metagenome]